MTNLRLTHMDKIFWPEKDISKGNLISYYDTISDYLLPHVKDRPISMNRYPDGIYGKHFYHKDFKYRQPEFLESIRIKSDGKEINYLMCQNKESLLYLINFGCIDINPWLSTSINLNSPTYCVIDLDPLHIDFSYVCQTACATYDVLLRYNIKALAKTSGATGLHIYIPLKPGYTFEDSKNFGKILATLINHERPKFTSIERMSAKREGKVYIDFLQNNPGQTLASVYSVRPLEEASVSCPLMWSELENTIDPKYFTMAVIKERLKKYGDLFSPVLKEENDITSILEFIKSASR